MAITADDVTKIARLARIAVGEEEKAALVQELGGIFRWIEQLNEVDTGGSVVVASVTQQPLPWREDVVTDGGQPDAVVANAPVSDYGCFVVPKVIGES